MPEGLSPSEVGKEIAEHRHKADEQEKEGGEGPDGYVRTTVYLATVLFLVGISGHFKVRAARIGLISVAGVILVFSSISLILAPKPPV
jgi:hypothetical protein